MIYSKGPLAYQEYIEKRKEQISDIQKQREMERLEAERAKEEGQRENERMKRDMEK